MTRPVPTTSHPQSAPTLDRHLRLSIGPGVFTTEMATDSNQGHASGGLIHLEAGMLFPLNNRLTLQVCENGLLGFGRVAGAGEPSDFSQWRATLNVGAILNVLPRILQTFAELGVGFQHYSADQYDSGREPSHFGETRSGRLEGTGIWLGGEVGMTLFEGLLEFFLRAGYARVTAALGTPEESRRGLPSAEIQLNNFSLEAGWAINLVRLGFGLRQLLFGGSD